MINLGKEVDCYHEVMKNKLSGYTGWLYPEEYQWLTKARERGSLPQCLVKPCQHWPIFTVCDASPYPPYHGKGETYKGFRSDPKPLMGVLDLKSPEEASQDEDRKQYLAMTLGMVGTWEDRM